MDLALSLLSLTAIALVLGALFLWKREGYRRQALLMLVLAAILAGNIVIWTLPDPSGSTLSAEAEKQLPR